MGNPLSNRFESLDLKEKSSPGDLSQVAEHAEMCESSFRQPSPSLNEALNEIAASSSSSQPNNAEGNFDNQLPIPLSKQKSIAKCAFKVTDSIYSVITYYDLWNKEKQEIIETLMLNARLPHISENNFSDEIIEKVKCLIQESSDMKTLIAIVKLLHPELRCPTNGCHEALKVNKVNMKCVSSNKFYAASQFINQVPTTLMLDFLQHMTVEDIYRVFHESGFCKLIPMSPRLEDEPIIKSPLSKSKPKMIEVTSEDAVKFLTNEINKLMKELAAQKQVANDLKAQVACLKAENEQLKKQLPSAIKSVSVPISPTKAPPSIISPTNKQPVPTKIPENQPYLKAAFIGQQRSKTTSNEGKRMSVDEIRRACAYSTGNDEFTRIYVKGFRKCKISSIKGIFKILGIESRQAPLIKFIDDCIEVYMRKSMCPNFIKCFEDYRNHEELKDCKFAVSYNAPNVRENINYISDLKELQRIERILPQKPFLKGIAHFLKHLSASSPILAQIGKEENLINNFHNNERKEEFFDC